MDMVKTDELNEYAAYVRAMSLRMDGEIFQNSGQDHARIVIDALLSGAQKSVKIVAGTLRDESYTPELVRGLISRLDVAKDVQIVLEKEHYDPKTKTNAVKMFEDAGSVVKVIEADLSNHFCLVDEQSFRFENDTEKSKALFAFGDQKTAGKLNSHFEKILSLAVDIAEFDQRLEPTV